MFYTVQAGDSLFLIAQKFNTTVESIISLNGLTSTALTVGQQLRIPLYTELIVLTDRANIRKEPNTSSSIIANVIKDTRLPVEGFWQNWYRVRLYNGKSGWISGNIVSRRVHGGDKPISKILGFYTLEEGPALPSSFNSFVNNTNNISELGLFMFRINGNNPTEIEKFGDFSDQDVNTLVALAHRSNIKIMPVIHNLLYRQGPTFAQDLVHELVSSPQNRRAFAQNIVSLIEKYNFDGVNIDIEDAYVEDSVDLSALYTEIANTLRPLGYYFSASIPSRVSDEPFNPFSDPFNYAAIGAAVDEFVVMLYNEHGWPGSGPGPVVSIGWMERVLRYTMTRVDKEKIVAAVSVFGFDFNLNSGTSTYVTYQMAIDLAQRYNSQIIFDDLTQTPMFKYIDEQGNQHEVWFENQYSIFAKIRLAWQLGISGLALWRLGMEDPAIWDMLSRDVVVRK